MSYSYDVKQLICAQKRPRCCHRAFWYGFLSAGNAFLPGLIRIYTEHLDFLELLIKNLKKMSENAADESRISVKGNKKTIYELSLTGMDAQGVFDALGVNKKSIENQLVDFEIMKNECCVKSFISGVFLSAGFISDPSKAYHCELVLREKSFADDVFSILESFDVSPKKTVRGADSVIYIKTSENISDLLNIMGAASFCFDYMNAGIEKQIRNTVNRQTNCDNANSDKTVSAAARQLEAIKKLQKDGFKGLSNELTDIALLRLENPELSMAELSALTEPPLSKSGVCHRLSKLIEIAENE